MKFLELGSVPLSPEDVVFLESRWNAFRAVLGMMIFISIYILFRMFISKIVRNKLNEADIYIFFSILILFPLAFLVYLLTTLGKNRWLVRFSLEGLFIKFRHFDRDRPDRVSVLFLPFSEITSASKWLENTESEYWTFLDLRLISPDIKKFENLTPDLEESESFIAKCWKVPYIPVKSKGDGRILLEWKGPKVCLAPSVERMLELLSERVTVDLGRPPAKRLRPSR